MSTTDNAFIRAYAEELAVALGRPAKQVDRRTIRPDGPSLVPSQSGPRVSLSGLYAESNSQQTAAEPEPTFDAEMRAEADTPDVPSTTRVVVSAATSAPAPAESPMPTAKDEPPHGTGTPADTVDRTSPVDHRPTQRRLDAGDTTALPSWHASFAEAVAKVHDDVPDAPDEPGVAEVADAEEVPDDELVAPSAAEEPRIDSRSGTIPPPPSTDGTFRPQWEVDRFQWPTAVDRLVNEYADWLDHVLDRLATEAEHGTKTTAITSCARGEGRTTLALSLARLAAARGMSVLLVDGDHENPKIAEQLGLSFNSGWDQSAGDWSSISEVAVCSIEDQLTVLPLSPRAGADHHDDQADSAAAIARLSSEYDIVLVDAGPMFTAVRHWFDRRQAHAVDAALVVRDVRNVTTEQLDDVIERLAGRETLVLGIAENFDSPAVTQSADSGRLAS